MDSLVRGDVGKSIKGSVEVEVRGVKNVRQNRVSPDRIEMYERGLNVHEIHLMGPPVLRIIFQP